MHVSDQSMVPATSIPDDLLLIMQSYVDPVPQPQIPTGGPSTFVAQALKVSARGKTDDEWSDGEDEVEMAIRVESDSEDSSNDLSSSQ
jgi:hypothetical protein